MIEKEYLKVTDINNYIKNILDNNSFLNKVYIKGEISNFKNHTRGHLYFTLKDETSRINAVMFQSSASNLAFKPEDGMNVLVTGRISAYPASGSYQIYVEQMELDGLGNLFIEFEKLKEKLYKEGLFNKEHKKTIPKYPERIGVITASTGAAVRDIMSTIKRRYPLCEVILFPTLVQGADAAPNIVKQIQVADGYDCDTLIVGRGGGSIEDLWAFNEEIVARAIYDSPVPIISAVGHEVDFTIADFVADLRAPTPTGAAEMAVPNMVEVFKLIDNYKIRLNENVNNKLILYNKRLEALKESYILKNPSAMYEVHEQKLSILIDKLQSSVKNKYDASVIRFNNIKNNYIMNNPLDLLKNKSTSLEGFINKLELLNPLGILKKGYSVVSSKDKIIKSYKEVGVGDIINVRLNEGFINASVTDTRKDDKNG